MTTSAQQRFAHLTAMFADRHGVCLPGQSSGRGFGAGALKVNGSICAMLSNDRLVVKLPAARVQELIGQHAGLPFDAGKGRPMKEWVMVPDGQEHAWPQLVEEAIELVGHRSGRT